MLLSLMKDRSGKKEMQKGSEQRLDNKKVFCLQKLKKKKALVVVLLLKEYEYVVEKKINGR